MPSQLLLFAPILALLIPLMAQPGSVSGKVVGLNSKTAKNATVVLRELKAGEMKDLTAGENGEFQFTGVPAGTYIVEACGSDFTASSLVNVGPIAYEANPHQTVSLTVLPKKAGEGSGLAVILLVVFVIAIGAFWYGYSTKPFFLRVPIITWTLWAALCILLNAMQHALIALNENDAEWAGAALVFVAVGIWQSASTIAAGAAARFGVAPTAGLSDFMRNARTQVLYVLPFLLSLLVLAINSMQNGTREWGSFVAKGEVAGYLVWLAVSVLVAWIVQFVRTRSRSWPTLVGWFPALVTALIGLVGYWLLYSARSSALETGTALTLGSPIIHLLLLLGEMCLLLSALTYWLDKHRVPLLTLLLLLIGIGVAFNRGDYTFESPAKSPARPTPSDAIAKRDRIVVVAAAGGGVQAAAWTARVLGGLAQADQRFQPAVRLVSGVSGGSVGAMYFINTYPTPQGGLGWSGDKAFRAAAMPLLDAVAWGLVNVDLPRILAGARNDDRGAILSRTLGVRAGLNDVRISRWSGAVQAGLPAVLLNATEVETGRPIVFSSTTLHSYGILDFAAAYEHDAEIPTAVRLSASFPFVTPVARLQGQDAQGRPFPHLADGGYYDNYGMYSLMAWLQEALAGSTHPPEVLVLRIEAFPASLDQTSPQGWPFQTWAPMTAMMSVRTAAQRQRNETSFQLFQQQYKPGLIREQTFRYEPPCACPDPPLSWDLSPVEIECVDRAWHSRKIQDEAAAVQHFLVAR